uniref:Uncharacterized protein n=1 Tax=Opuntia streptacantha TaxID=393608 RepID=A0A7C9DEV5_OPUST
MWLDRQWRYITFKKIWCSSFFAVAWSLWLMRNEVIFQQKQVDINGLCCLIRWRVTLWTKAWRVNLPYNVDEVARHSADIPVILKPLMSRGVASQASQAEFVLAVFPVCVGLV